MRFHIHVDATFNAVDVAEAITLAADHISDAMSAKDGSDECGWLGTVLIEPEGPIGDNEARGELAT